MPPARFKKQPDWNSGCHYKDYHKDLATSIQGVKVRDNYHGAICNPHWKLDLLFILAWGMIIVLSFHHHVSVLLVVMLRVRARKLEAIAFVCISQFHDGHNSPEGRSTPPLGKQRILPIIGYNIWGFCGPRRTCDSSSRFPKTYLGCIRHQLPHFANPHYLAYIDTCT